MMSRTPLRVWVVLAAGLLAISWSPILVRYASAAPGQALAFWRTVFAALLLAPVAGLKARRAMRALTRRDLMLIGAAGVMLGLHFIAWIESLYYTSVASASVLVTTSPLFIAVLGFLVLRERLTVRTMAAIGGAVVGAALIGMADAGEGVFPHAGLGNGLALAGALLIAIYLLIGRAVRQHTAFLAYLFPLYAIAALTTLVAALIRGVPLMQPWPILALCLLMALGPQLVGHGSLNYAVRYLPAALLGLLSLMEPIGASLFAYGLFGEVPPLLALVGMGIVLGAVAVAFTGRRSGPPEDH